MQNFDIGSKEYWNKRVVENKQDLNGMIFQDEDREEFWSRATTLLALYKNKKTLDVCCGHGRFSDIFDNYLGVDFSEEILKLAGELHPLRSFILANVKEWKTEEKFDFIFEVNSLHVLSMKPQEFADMFKGNLSSSGTIACLEKSDFVIFNFYDHQHN